MRFQGQEDKGKAVKKENQVHFSFYKFLSSAAFMTFCRFDVAWIKKKKQICIAMLNLTSHLLPLFRGWYSEMFDNGSSLDNFLRHD